MTTMTVEGSDQVIELTFALHGEPVRVFSKTLPETLPSSLVGIEVLTRSEYEQASKSRPPGKRGISRTILAGNERARN